MTKNKGAFILESVDSVEARGGCHTQQDEGPECQFREWSLFGEIGSHQGLLSQDVP